MKQITYEAYIDAKELVDAYEEQERLKLEVPEGFTEDFDKTPIRSHVKIMRKLNNGDVYETDGFYDGDWYSGGILISNVLSWEEK